MKKHFRLGNQAGVINALVLPLILLVVLLVAAVIFGVWAYGSRQDYKNNVDAKISTAVAAAKQSEGNAKEKEFAEREKNPLRTYTGPSEYGSISIQYPKTWSAYVADDGSSSPYVNGYFQPSVVPDTQSESSVFALRVQVIDSSYAQSLRAYADQVTAGKVTVQPYSLPKVSSVVGARISGQLDSRKTGTKVLLPLRDKTLAIWTESAQYQPDFDNIIMANMSFEP